MNNMFNETKGISGKSDVHATNANANKNKTPPSNVSVRPEVLSPIEMFNEYMEKYLNLNFYNIEQIYPIHLKNKDAKNNPNFSGVKVTAGFILRGMILQGDIVRIEDALSEEEVGGYYKNDPGAEQRSMLVNYLKPGIEHYY